MNDSELGKLAQRIFDDELMLEALCTMYVESYVEAMGEDEPDLVAIARHRGLIERVHGPRLYLSSSG